MEILHSVEGGDVEQVCSNLETNLSCLRLLMSLSLVFYILHALIVYIYYMLDIPLCFIYIHALDYLRTLDFNQESHSGTSTLNLEKS